VSLERGPLSLVSTIEELLERKPIFLGNMLPLSFKWNLTLHISSGSILLVTLGPGVYSASNSNEYQKHSNNNISRE
jgi:hypothetical protein